MEITFIIVLIQLFVFVFKVVCICMRLQPHILPVDTGDGWDILAGKGKRNGDIEV